MMWWIDLIGVSLVMIIGIGFFIQSIRECWYTRNYPRLESPIESRLYYALIQRGYDPRTQVRCGPFRIDMCIGRIAIECDGKAFHSSPEQKRYDKRRDSYIRRHGYKSVLRFTGSEINKNVWKCVDRIEQKLSGR